MRIERQAHWHRLPVFWGFTKLAVVENRYRYRLAVDHFGGINSCNGRLGGNSGVGEPNAGNRSENQHRQAAL